MTSYRNLLLASVAILCSACDGGSETDQGRDIETNPLRAIAEDSDADSDENHGDCDPCCAACCLAGEEIGGNCREHRDGGRPLPGCQAGV